MAHVSPKATAHAVSAKPAHAVMAKGSGLTQAVPQTAPSLVERVQTALAKLGDYPGKVDGILGPETIKALSSFQQAQGLPQTGRADVATIERLGVSILP
jgi:peptidoglycan hydrolase-like protein with peptidoglycan-binding domain